MRPILALIFAAALLAPPAAHADTIAVAVALQYVPDTVTIEVGQTLDFLNADPASLTDGHDITHDVAPGRRLFASDTVLIGTITPVIGVGQLEVGLYPFTCTRHPSMEGTLQVVVT